MLLEKSSNIILSVINIEVRNILHAVQTYNRIAII